jgi:hypothetical protein
LFWPPGIDTIFYAGFIYPVLLAQTRWLLTVMRAPTLFETAPQFYRPTDLFLFLRSTLLARFSAARNTVMWNVEPASIHPHSRPSDWVVNVTRVLLYD